MSSLWGLSNDHINLVLKGYLGSPNMICHQVDVAITAWCCYEWIVTFDKDMNHVWLQKWSVSTWIFAGARYTILLVNLLQILPITSPLSFARMQQLQSFTLIIQNSAFALFTALRTCALYNRNKFIFLAVFLPAMARTLFDTVMILSHASLADAESRMDACFISMSLSMVAYEGFSWSTYILLIASDALALVLTWRKAIGISKDTSKLGAGISLSKVLVRDGSFLFVGLLMCNILNIALDNLSCYYTFTGGSTIPATLSAIMTCRFISNLKQAADGPNGNSTVRKISLVQFNADRLFGNLGQSLDTGEEVEGREPQHVTQESDDVELSQGVTYV